MSSPGHATRIMPPRLPEPPTPFRFPFVAAIAPVVIAIVIWLVTGSAFALLFAALGPVAAIATFVDSRVSGRRTNRRELTRFFGDLELVRSDVDRAQRSERDELVANVPDAAAIATRRGADPSRWTAGASAPVLVTLGTGTIRSSTLFESRVREGDLADSFARELDDLDGAAAILDRAPVVVDARLGIGVFGQHRLATAFARTIVVQLGWALSPGEYWCHLNTAAEVFSALPHAKGALANATGASFAEFGARSAPVPLIRVATADSQAHLPDSCRVVVGITDGRVLVMRHPEFRQPTPVVPSYVSIEHVREWALATARDAQRDGLVVASAALAATAELASMLGTVDHVSRGTLACAVARTEDGLFELDLVKHGPHAVVGGTTGSGKSELLIAWVLAMAATYSPDRVTFLLVDFKGGSAFSALTPLKHTVGLITDLDESSAARALESLLAELRHRERTLVAAGARSIDDTDELPRLVIVVDEFAAMTSQFPELHALFSDLAARGRSLGIHLILCTQRPAGVVRDAVLANADLRISLRVNNRADSLAVVGSEDAAEIPGDARGRGVVQLAGGPGRTVQFAIASERDALTVANRWLAAASPRRPWCEPLDDVISPDVLEPTKGGLSFGVTDVPNEQRRGIACWRPGVDGHMLVLGAPSSGKSTALAAIARTARNVDWIPAEPAAAWDAIAELTVERQTAGAGGDSLIVIDDFDSLVSRFSAEYRGEFIERVASGLRDGRSRGIYFAIAAQRSTPDFQSLLALLPARLWLRHATRNEFVVAGGDGTSYIDRLPPGGGVWQGERVQVVYARPVDRHPVRPAESRVAMSRPLAIVSTRVGSLRRLLDSQPEFLVVELAGVGVDVRTFVESQTQSQGRRVVLVGDVDEWQSRWGAMSALRPVAEILFDGCTPADFRVLTRSRELPPPLSPPNGLGTSPLLWRLEQDGTATRVRLTPPQP